MKISSFRIFPTRSWAPLVVVALISGAGLCAASTNTNSVAASPGGLGTGFTEPPIPQSVFVIPKKVAEGKDPFFPNSTRPYGADTLVKAAAPVTPIEELVLKGISGSVEKPLAIINTTTFSTGEENDVLTKVGRIRLRLLEINMTAGTVLIQVGGERRELRLQPLK